MPLFKFPRAMIICFFLLVSIAIITIRKFIYRLYMRFPNASRIYEFGRKRKFKFYWTRRADFSTFDLIRLYVLWVMVRFDSYCPIVDCERQAAKAQYFHMEGRYSSMRGWHFRRINPKAWPILFMRGFLAFLFPALFYPCNQRVYKSKANSACRACTACNAKEDLEMLVANYKGARIILSKGVTASKEPSDGDKADGK